MLAAKLQLHNRIEAERQLVSVLSVHCRRLTQCLQANFPQHKHLSRACHDTRSEREQAAAPACTIFWPANFLVSASFLGTTSSAALHAKTVEPWTCQPRHEAHIKGCQTSAAAADAPLAASSCTCHSRPCQARQQRQLDWRPCDMLTFVIVALAQLVASTEAPQPALAVLAEAACRGLPTYIAM